METYIALLRGVNVGGNMLKMERLRALWEQMGFAQVRTYIQSGNVIFLADSPPKKWAAAVEKKLAGETRLPVCVIFRSATEIKNAIAQNPYAAKKGIDLSRLYITFLADRVSKDNEKKLHALPAADTDEFQLLGQEIHLHCPGGYGNTKLSNNLFEKTLAIKATTRNWNTLNKLYEMATAIPHP